VSGWLVDTNVLSEVRRPRPNRKVVAFLAAQPLELLHVSTVSLAEIRFGIELLTDVHRRDALNAWLTHEIRPLFSQRVLDVTEDVILKWRVLVEEGRKSGHTYSQPDLFIAATALSYGMAVVSRDTIEYERAGARVVNPWDS
jgi:hypothetical protein